MSKSSQKPEERVTGHPPQDQESNGVRATATTSIHPWFDAEDYAATFAGSEHWVAVAFDGEKHYLLSVKGPWEVVQHQVGARARVINPRTFRLYSQTSLHSILTKTIGTWHMVEVPQSMVQEWIAQAKEEYQRNPPRISRAYQRMFEVLKQVNEAANKSPTQISQQESVLNQLEQYRWLVEQLAQIAADAKHEPTTTEKQKAMVERELRYYQQASGNLEELLASLNG